MKKSVAACWVFALGLVLVSTVMIAEAKAQIIGRNLTLRELSTTLQTPDQIAHYMWRHFVFEQDQRQFGQNEYWQTPQELLINRKGDCEDFAQFSHTLLKAAGISSFMFNIYGDGYAHTVTVFKENGKYNAIDGVRVMHYQADSLDELSEMIHPFWKKSAIVGASPKKRSGRIMKLLDRLQAEKKLSTFA